jgi:hypothetical protein
MRLSTLALFAVFPGAVFAVPVEAEGTPALDSPSLSAAHKFCLPVAKRGVSAGSAGWSWRRTAGAQASRAAVIAQRAPAPRDHGWVPGWPGSWRKTSQ